MGPQLSQSLNYIYGLNGLRCIACLSVFAVHFQQITEFDFQFKIFNFTKLMKNGNTGVSLFFILSGFLLALPYLGNKNLEKSHSNLLKFWFRRFLRIAPAYYICLTGLIILQQRWAHTNATNDILLHYFFLHNLSEQSFYNLNPAFWTLAVEAQFYLLLPLLLYVINRLKPFTAFILLFFAGAGTYLTHFYFMTAITANIIPWSFNFTSINTTGNVLGKSVFAHLPHFILGISCGWIYLFVKEKLREKTPKNVETKCDFIICLSIFITILILSTPLDELFILPYARYNYPVITFSLATIITAVPFSKISQNILESWPFRTLGLYSYGIYIYHLPIQHFIARIMEKLGLHVTSHCLIFGLSSLFFSIAIAAFSYTFIERHFLKISKKR